MQMMPRESSVALVVVCLVGSAAILAFMVCVAAALGISWTARETGLTGIVCLAFCIRAANHGAAFSLALFRLIRAIARDLCFLAAFAVAAAIGHWRFRNSPPGWRWSAWQPSRKPEG
jgi:hypothetical protein